MFHYQSVKSSLQFSYSAFSWILFGSVWSRYMVIDVGSAYGLHKRGLASLLYRSAIHRQLPWYPVLRNKTCQCGSNVCIIRLRNVKIGIEATLVKVYLAGNISYQ